jgi:2-phosphosulfolactate phosphatase
MSLSVVLTPAEILSLAAANLSETTAVVFDVLRATSTMTMALHHGAAAIYPAKDIAEAHALKEKHPDALLGGERHGEIISGFDLGNSPLEYNNVTGREIISTTTNGTIALRAVTHAGMVIAGSLLNISAMASWLAAHQPAKLLMVCAGTGNDFAIEDALGAGALLHDLTSRNELKLQPSDAAKMLLTLWNTHRNDVPSVLANSRNGSRLCERGRTAEVECCAQLSVFQTVGILSGDALRPHLVP